MATINTYRKFCEVSNVAFKTCERRDRHTDMLIAILHTPTGDKVILTTTTATHN